MTETHVLSKAGGAIVDITSTEGGKKLGWRKGTGGGDNVLAASIHSLGCTEYIYTSKLVILLIYLQ